MSGKVWDFRVTGGFVIWVRLSYIVDIWLKFFFILNGEINFFVGDIDEGGVMLKFLFIVEIVWWLVEV